MYLTWRYLRWLLILLIWFVFSGCFRIYLPKFPHQLKVQINSNDVALRLSFYAKDQIVLPDIIAATKEAFRVNHRWGKLNTDLHIRIFPNHKTIEQAVMRSYGWLRAWAMYDQIYLQSPLTWRARYYRIPLLELLVHEITHITMYQLCGDQHSWNTKKIPLWFREGMASVTANQQYRRAKWSKIKDIIYNKRIGKSLLKNPASYLKKEQPLVYSLGHWMFVVFLERWKDKGVRLILAKMRSGVSFKKAFKLTSGITPKTFKKYFRKRLSQKRPHSVVRKIVTLVQNASF